jgi:hypothetical protein
VFAVAELTCKVSVINASGEFNHVFGELITCKVSLITRLVSLIAFGEFNRLVSLVICLRV